MRKNFVKCVKLMNIENDCVSLSSFLFPRDILEITNDPLQEPRQLNFSLAMLYSAIFTATISFIKQVPLGNHIICIQNENFNSGSGVYRVNATILPPRTSNSALFCRLFQTNVTYPYPPSYSMDCPFYIWTRRAWYEIHLKRLSFVNIVSLMLFQTVDEIWTRISKIRCIVCAAFRSTSTLFPWFNYILVGKRPSTFSSF